MPVVRRKQGSLPLAARASHLASSATGAGVGRVVTATVDLD